MTLNNTEHLLIITSKITECVSISAFASLIGISLSFASSAATTKICSVTAGIQKHGSIILKRRNMIK